jgi:hypothetical protein
MYSVQYYLSLIIFKKLSTYFKSLRLHTRSDHHFIGFRYKLQVIHYDKNRWFRRLSIITNDDIICQNIESVILFINITQPRELLIFINIMYHQDQGCQTRGLRRTFLQPGQHMGTHFSRYWCETIGKWKFNKDFLSC